MITNMTCRTVYSYGMEQSSVEKYRQSLEKPRKAGITQGVLSGLTIGATAGDAFMFIQFGIYGVFVINPNVLIRNLSSPLFV
jgi:hypothetical protein